MKSAEYEEYCKISVAHHGIVCIISEKNPFAGQILSGLINHDVLAMVFSDPALQNWSFLPGVRGSHP
jgi:hypothetical protein